jgi:hypothetical protein
MLYRDSIHVEIGAGYRYSEDFAASIKISLPQVFAQKSQEPTSSIDRRPDKPTLKF